MKKIAAKQIESSEVIVFVTRAQLNAAATADQLKIGEVYLVTDEDRLAIGLSASTYETYAKASEAGGSDGSVSSIVSTAKTISINTSKIVIGKFIINERLIIDGKLGVI